MTPVPRLHAIAADEAQGRPDFEDLAGAVLRAGGADLALHLRAHGRPGGELFALARRLAPAAAATGSLLVINDRVDVALAVAGELQASGVGGAAAPPTVGIQLGARSLPLERVRAMVPDAPIGCSVHGMDEAAAGEGADWLLLGTIYETPSHPGRPGAGPALVRAVAARVRAPVVAIGGVTPERVPELMAAGAHGVAVLRGVWAAEDAQAAVRRYLEVLRTEGLEGVR